MSAGLIEDRERCAVGAPETNPSKKNVKLTTHIFVVQFLVCSGACRAQYHVSSVDGPGSG